MKVSVGGVKSQPYSSWKSIRDPKNQMYSAAFMMLESLLTVVAPGMIIYLGRLQVSELSEWLNKWNMTESMLSLSCRITYSWACAENEKNPSGLVQITMKLSPSPLLEIAAASLCLASARLPCTTHFLSSGLFREQNRTTLQFQRVCEVSLRKFISEGMSTPCLSLGTRSPVADWSHSACILSIFMTVKKKIIP